MGRTGGLWVDAHRPRSLKELDHHPALTARLHKVAAAGDVPHLLFYGPSGAGKKTRIMALLREMFGPGAERVKLERKSFKTPSNKPLDLVALGSAYHLELNPSDVGIYDRIVIQEVIKEIAQSVALDTTSASSTSTSTSTSSSSSSSLSTTTTSSSNTSTTTTSKRFKVIVIMEADQMSKQAQHGLRRTMEKYAATCRIILCCEALSKIIEPVRSRCLAIRVPAPTTEEVASILQATCAKESVTMHPTLTSNIAKMSRRNLRRALLMAEASRVQAGSTRLGEDAAVQLPDWELSIAALAREIGSSQNADTLLKARARLYELLANCIPPELILKTLVGELSRKLDDALKTQLVQMAAFYECRLVSQGQKAIFHLEAFVAKFMHLYRESVMCMFE